MSAGIPYLVSRSQIGFVGFVASYRASFYFSVEFSGPKNSGVRFPAFIYPTANSYNTLTFTLTFIYKE